MSDEGPSLLLALPFLYYNNSRVWDYTYHHYRKDYYYITTKPSKLRPINNLMRVFDTSTWLLILASLIGSTVAYSTICMLKKVSTC